MSPKIFEYKGISLSYFSKEHLPAHVHAHYESAAMKVEFHQKGDKIVKINYIGLRGFSRFKPAQMRDLKKLIEKYKYDIVDGFLNFAFKNLPAPKKQVITRRIK